MNIWNRIHDTPSVWELSLDNTQLNEIAGIPEGWKEEESWTLKYIDDGITGEVICNNNAVCHITEKKQEKYLHAQKSEKYLKTTSKNASLIGMKINAKKTRMICITVAKNSLINSYINLPDRTQINGSDTLRMLGFI